MVVKINVIVSWMLRALVAGTAMAAAIIMGTAHDSAQILTLKFEAKYTNSPSFKYFVIVNSVVSCYSVIVLFLPFKAMLWRLLLLVDTVMTILLTSSFSAAMAIAYVGKKGNGSAGWLPICGQVEKFCDEATRAMISGFLAIILYFILLIYSLHGLLTPLLCFKE